MKYFTINTFLTKGLNRLCPHAMEWVILVFVVNTNNIAHICWSAFLNINLKKVPQDMNNNLLIISVEALCLTSYITKSGPLQTCFIARQWHPEFFWGRPVHTLNPWLASSGEIFKICAARYLKMHFLALSVLILSCKTFPNYLSLHYKTLFFMDYLKKKLIFK